MIYNRLYSHRFEIFFAIQLAILFGSLLFPDNFFNRTLVPILFLINTGAGVLLISKKKKLMWFVILLFAISLFVFGSDMFQKSSNYENHFLIRLSVYFVFYIIVTHQIILQIWNAKKVDNVVIIGLMCGYLSLGFLSFFLFASIETLSPNSFEGISVVIGDTSSGLDSLMYYSYVTLMTIGYGDITPATLIARKASILTGLIGQFYLVIVTAIVVGKYLNTNSSKS